MGTVSNYLSQRRRIELYEKQMRGYSEFARLQRDLNHAQREVDVATQKNLDVLRDRIDDITTAAGQDHEILRHLVAAQHAPRWRARRASRRWLRSLEAE